MIFKKLFELSSDLENHEFDKIQPGATGATPVEQLRAFWPLISIALTIAKVFTGPKGDAKVDCILRWGEDLFG